VLVGPTATGRKGSSWGHVRRLLADADPAFAHCLVGGLSSGEGLIAQVRDPLDDEHDSQAPPDKRRLVVEPEFAQTLKVLAREGNTLSASSARHGTESRFRPSCATIRCVLPPPISRSSGTSPAMSCFGT
jgi:hypothetical protein